MGKQNSLYKFIMVEYHSTKKEGRLDFKQIILGHFKRILELSCSEFCGGYWNYVFIGNTKTKVYVTDKRKEFVQAVEMLALALKPHFDKKGKDKDDSMEKDYEDYEEELEELDKEYKKKKSEEDKIEYSKKHLKLIKTLFEKISCLLKRLDYFKTEKEVDLDEEGDIDENE